MTRRWLIAVAACWPALFGADIAPADEPAPVHALPPIDYGAPPPSFQPADAFAAPTPGLPPAHELPPAPLWHGPVGYPAQPVSFETAPQSPPPAFDYDALAKRVAELEQARQDDAAAAKKKKADDESKPTVKIAARIHTDYWSFPDVDPAVGLLEDPDGVPNDRVLFRRVRLGIAGTILDNMLYKMDVDFNNPNQPQLKDMYLGWSDLRFFQTVLVGMQKRPYGLDHWNSSNANIFLERPIVVDGFLQDTRRWGITSNGVSETERYNWHYGFFMAQDPQNTGQVLTTLNESYQGEFAARLADTFWYDEPSDGRYYGHFALAGRYGNADGNDPANNVAHFQTRPEARTTNRWIDTGSITGANNYSLFAVENVWNYGPINFTAEYMHSWVNRPFADNVAFYGGYCQIAWVLTGEHHPWDRVNGALKPLKPFENFWLVNTLGGGKCNGWGAWELAFRYEHAEFTDAPFYGGRVNDLTLGLQWFWNQNARLQFNYIFGDMQGRFANNNLANPRNGNYQIAGLRFIMFL